MKEGCELLFERQESSNSFLGGEVIWNSESLLGNSEGNSEGSLEEIFGNFLGNFCESLREVWEKSGRNSRSLWEIFGKSFWKLL
jgi:hypothetical protein